MISASISRDGRKSRTKTVVSMGNPPVVTEHQTHGKEGR